MLKVEESYVIRKVSMVNVLKFQTLYSISFLPKFCFLFELFLKILSENANSVDPDQTAPEGAV